MEQVDSAEVQKKLNAMAIDLRRQMKAIKVKVSWQVLSGVPEQSLLNYSAEIAADLIVLGADRVNLQTGSSSIRVAKSIVKNADHSVIVVRTPGSEFDTEAE